MDNKNELLLSYSYIEWLDFFTKRNGCFCLIDHNFKTFLSTDKEKLDQLMTFYYQLLSYAEENNIVPCSYDFGSYLKIKMNDVGFRVGFYYKDGPIYFCDRVRISKKDKDFVDFSNIVNYERNLEKDKPSKKIRVKSK